jgi:hypothetical protein
VDHFSHEFLFEAYSMQTKITFCKTHEGMKLNKGKILKFCKHTSHESFVIHVTFQLDLNLLKLCIFPGFSCMGPKLGIGSWCMKCCWFNQNNKAIIFPNFKEGRNQEEAHPHVGMSRILCIKGHESLTNSKF